MKPITLYRHVENGELKWYPHQGVMYKAFVDKLKEGDTVEVSLKKQRRKKTNPQLGYWYGILIPFAVDALREAGHNTLFEVSVGNLKTGVATDKETVDLLFKVLFKTHTIADKVPQKRNMTTEQMSELIDYALKWLAENLGFFAPPPRDDQ